MALLYCGVNLSETVLMVWNPVLRVQLFVDPFKYSFSSIFEIVGSTLIGQQEVMSIGFFPGLGSIIICACFNDLGQYSSRIIAFSMYKRFSSPFCGNSFSILAVMRSIPGAFLWFNFVI